MNYEGPHVFSDDSVLVPPSLDGQTELPGNVWTLVTVTQHSEGGGK